LILGLILLISYFLKAAGSSLGIIDSTLFLQLGFGYVAFNCLILLWQFTPYFTLESIWHYSTILVIDILIVVGISYTCGGVTSGMSHLVLIPVAAGSALFRVRLSTFFAAVATIAVIYSEVYLFLRIPDADNYNFQAGLLGLQLFLLSFGIQYLGNRIRHKETINRQQAASIQALQAINEQVINRMQTGILVMRSDSVIINSNDSARSLIHPELQNPGTSNLTMPEPLEERYLQWLANPSVRSTPFRIHSSSPELQANFAFLPADPAPNVLIFLEDFSRLSSRAHHLKLMALGRLTASIAHEIRNPLSAISHACQLLNESEHIHEEDQRLLAIITNHTGRVDKIIANILQLSRQQQELPEFITLGQFVETFRERFISSFGEDIEISTVVEDPGMQIRFAASQMEQLLTNLCENGLRHSFQATGKYQIAIHVRLNGITGAGMLDIIDEGRGVSEELAEQIFEPFFTTESTGTGLGLFICKEICEANQARLFYCRNIQGKSCFRIAFAHHDRLIS